MVMRYAHHHPESLRAGIEILDRVPAGVSTVLAQSAGVNPSVETPELAHMVVTLTVLLAPPLLLQTDPWVMTARGRY
jgi:hypothetical protein